MSRNLRLLLFFLILLSATSAFGQGFNVGIRAGIGQNTFLGSVEEDYGEGYGFSGGFHFGLNFQLNFSELVGWRSEIVYNQMGSSYNLDTPEGYYIFAPDPLQARNTNIIIRDTSQISLTHSNAYLQFPQTFHFNVGDKLELFAGGYFGFLLSPVATGSIVFGGPNGTQEHSFRQGLNFNYFGDDANTEFEFGQNTGRDILLRADGWDSTIRSIANSYTYQQFKQDDSRFFSIDYGLIAGASYYVNRGLYIMGRLEYGVKDITRNSVDYSFARVNNNETPILSNDSDKNLGIYISIGFKF